MEKKGEVYLVGAGPGDSGLVTERGLARLRNCDVVVYDHLASERLLDEIPVGCRKIYVGKQAGLHSMKQEEINQILVELAKDGKRVVRLKGGDPFVFGRGGEEAMALLKAEIPFEVVSGVTSAVAALAAAGIPVTHRAVSRSFHVMTGHTLALEETLPADFDEFAKLSGTLVFLMGLGNLALIVNGLLKKGKPLQTPAAVIEKGTLPGQRVVRGTLEDIEKRVKEAHIKTPAIIVVGEVAALDFSSTIQLPLEGVKIGITGTEDFTERLKKQLEELGASVTGLVSMKVDSHRGKEAMQKVYCHLENYSWIVWTSANAVREFFMGLLESGRDYRALGHMKFAVVGEGTAKELYRYGFLSDYIPSQYRTYDLAVGLCNRVNKEDRILIPRSSKGSQELTQILEKAEIEYDDVALYDVVNKKNDDGKIAESVKNLDYVTFASASGVDAFFEVMGDGVGPELLETVKTACIGDVTEKTLKHYGKQADLVAKVFDIPGLVKVICQDVKLKKI